MGQKLSHLRGIKGRAQSKERMDQEAFFNQRKRMTEEEDDQMQGEKTLADAGNIDQAAAVFSREGMELFATLFTNQMRNIKSEIMEALPGLVEAAVEKKHVELINAMSGSIQAINSSVMATMGETIDRTTQEVMGSVFSSPKKEEEPKEEVMEDRTMRLTTREEMEEIFSRKEKEDLKKEVAGKEEKRKSWGASAPLVDDAEQYFIMRREKIVKTKEIKAYLEEKFEQSVDHGKMYFIISNVQKRLAGLKSVGFGQYMYNPNWSSYEQEFVTPKKAEKFFKEGKTVYRVFHDGRMFQINSEKELLEHKKSDNFFCIK
jgi:hypothetical protein